MTLSNVVADIYAEEPPIQLYGFSLEPREAIKRYGLTGRESVNPADYPPGTWFYYPGDGLCYVREV